MIGRPSGYKIHFRKQPPFRGNLCFPCQCDIFLFFEFLLLGNSSTALVFSYNQINEPDNFYVNYRECFGYFTQLAETSLFILKKTLKMPPSFEIVLVSRRPSFSDAGTFSVTVRSREKTMETID